MKMKTWNYFSAAVSLVGAVLFGVQCWRYKSFTLKTVLDLLLFAIGVVIGIVKVRCPFCKHGLGLLFSGRFCPHCGCELEEKRDKGNET